MENKTANQNTTKIQPKYNQQRATKPKHKEQASVFDIFRAFN